MKNSVNVKGLKVRTWFVVILFCLLSQFFLVYAGNPTREGELLLKCYAGNTTAASYNDRNGSLQGIREFEVPLDTVPYKESVHYKPNYEVVFAGFYGEYGVSERLTLTADLPLAYYFLEEQSTHTRQISRDTIMTFNRDTTNTRFMLRYIGLGARYQIRKTEKVQLSLLATIRIPTGFSQGNTLSADSPFLSDGAFEGIAGLEGFFPSSFGWVALDAKIHARDEDLRHQFLVNAEVGFSRIPGTHFKFTANLVQSLHSFQKAREFQPRETTLQESHFSGGAAFGLFFTEKFFVEASYSVRIFGANMWNSQTVLVSAGWKL